MLITWTSLLFGPFVFQMKNPLFQDATTVVMNPMHVQEDWSKPLDSKANKHFIPENLWSTVISESQTILYADHNFREPQEPSVAKRIKDFVMRTLHSISLYFKANTYFRYDLQHVYSHTHLLVLFNLIASSCCTGVVVRPLHSLSTFSLFLMMKSPISLCPPSPLHLSVYLNIWELKCSEVDMNY